MTCIKTGCWIHLTEYDQYLYGDLYQYGPVLIARVSKQELHNSAPLGAIIWAKGLVAGWFDRSKEEIRTIVFTDYELLFYYDHNLREFVAQDPAVEFSAGSDWSHMFQKEKKYSSELRRALEPFANFPDCRHPGAPDAKDCIWGRDGVNLTNGDFDLARKTWKPF